MHDPGDLSALGLDGAEVGGILEIDAGYFVGHFLLQVDQIEQAGQGVDLHRRNGGDNGVGVVLDAGQAVRRDRLGHQGLGATGDAGSHPHAGRGSHAPIVGGGVDHALVHQLGDAGSELELGLKLAVIGHGIAHISGQKLVAQHHGGNHGRDIVIVNTGTQETRVFLAVLILGQHFFHVLP